MNNALNFHFLQTDLVIQVACIVSWTSIFTCQMILVAYFFICWFECFGTDWAVHCIVVFIPLFLGSAVSLGFYWSGVVYWWLLRLGPDPNTFQQRHPPYSVGVFQSTAHHCISSRCSSYMIHDADIGWWRILMTMANTSLVYIMRFRICVNE